MIAQHEIYSETAKNLSIEVKGGDVFAVDTAIEKGKAARVIDDGRLGFAFSTKPETSESELLEMANVTAKSVEKDVDLSFPPPSVSNSLQPNFGGIISMSKEEKVALTKELEASAFNYDKRIKLVRQPSYEETVKEVEIKNSNGVSVKFTTALCAVRLTAIAEDEHGSERASEVEYSLDPKKLNAAVIGRTAAERAISYLKSRKIASRKSPIILDRRVVAEVLGLIAPSFFADSVFKNRSRFKGKLNSKVYSTHINIINDPTLLTGLSSVPYDAEGAVTKRTPVVRGGILQNLLSDTFYAKKAGCQHTASSVRQLISQPPKIGVQNFYIEPGKKSVQALKKIMGQGLYVTDVMGLHMVNPVTGDMSVGAEGFWIEDGRDLHGVKGMTIAGNLHDMLLRTAWVGSDLKFWHLTGGVSLLIEEAAISGS